MTPPEQPYSRRDPYWGIDEYGRPISYGRPSLYGSPHPVDPEVLADQVTYLQPRPDELPIDPAAFAAPSVYRPNWPVDNSSGYFPTVKSDSDIADSDMATERISPPEPEREPEPEPEPESVQLVLPAFIGSRRPMEPAASPPPPANSPRRRLLWIGVGVVALALVAGVAFVASSPDKAHKPRGDADAGTLRHAWQTPTNSLALDVIAVGDTVVSVECDAGTSDTGRAFRTRENPDSCALVGRDVRAGGVRWRLDRQPIGALLASVGPAVVAYGGPQALVVRASSGEVTRALDGAVLLGHADTVAVFSERTGNSARAVAIDVGDGREIWSAPVSADLAAEHARSVKDAAATLPSGFDRMFYDRVAHDDAYVLLPESLPATQLRIREIKTGTVVASSDESKHIVGLASGRALSVSGTAPRVLSAEPLGKSDATWQRELTDTESVTACSALVCLRDESKNTATVLDPAKGTVVSRNEQGPLFVRHTGDVAAVLRCGAVTPGNSCSGGASGVEVVVVSTAKTVWRGNIASFAAVAAGKDATMLIVGSSPPNSDRVEISVFTDAGKQMNVGNVALRAWNPAPSGELKAAGAQVPDLSCTAVDRTFVCGTRWTGSRITAWRFAVSG